MKWAKELQWNPGCFDAKVFLAADPNGFFLALDKATGEFVGCVCGVRYGLDKGFIGIYIVRKEFRGRGIGMALFSKAMQHLEGRIVALDAVEEQIPNYQKWNLKVTRWNSRYKTIFNFDRIRGCEDANSGLLTHDLPTSVTDLVEIAAFDRACIGMDRSTPGFFKAFFSQPDLKCVRSADGWGILVIRRAADGYRAGPFYAKTPRIARSLMHALLEKYSEELNGQNLYFDMVR